MKKSAHHDSILSHIRRKKGQGTTQSGRESYLLSGHFYYGISVPVRRAIAKEWLKENRDISDKDFLALVTSLFEGDSHDEKTLASILLSYHAKGRAAVTFRQLDSWLDHLAGWAEIDSLCSNTFTAAEMLAKWQGKNSWEHFIRKLSRDKNINKRRAALVFLTRPFHVSSDHRVRNLSFEVTDVLKHEKPIIITKAISWLLRSGVSRHKKAVTAYLRANAGSLPKIAIRETDRKIKTGRK